MSFREKYVVRFDLVKMVYIHWKIGNYTPHNDVGDGESVVYFVFVGLGLILLFNFVVVMVLC